MSKGGIIAGLLLALFLLLLFGKRALAHEQWFVHEGTHPGEHFSLDLITLLLSSGAALFVVAAYSLPLQRWSGLPSALLDKAHGAMRRGMDWRILAALSGINLIVYSVTGVFLAPDIFLPDGTVHITGMLVQLAIGILLLSQIFFSLAGLLIVLAAIPLAAIYTEAEYMLPYFSQYIPLAVAMAVAGISSCPDRLARKWIRIAPGRLEHLPIPMVRIGSGTLLIYQALENKLLNPDIALTFLDKYPLNFMAQAGLTGFTNLHFVFATGVIQLVFGVLLTAGIATRLVSAAFFGFLLSTIILIGPLELIGHLPLFGIALLLVYEGAGRYRVPSPSTSVARIFSRARAT